MSRHHAACRLSVTLDVLPPNSRAARLSFSGAAINCHHVVVIAPHATRHQVAHWSPLINAPAALPRPRHHHVITSICPSFHAHHHHWFSFTRAIVATCRHRSFRRRTSSMRDTTYAPPRTRKHAAKQHAMSPNTPRNMRHFISSSSPANTRDAATPF